MNKFHLIGDFTQLEGLDPYSSAKRTPQYKSLLKYFKNITTPRQINNGTFTFEDEDHIVYVITCKGYIRRYRKNTLVKIFTVSDPFNDVEGYVDLFCYLGQKHTEYFSRSGYPSARYNNVLVDKKIIKYLVDGMNKYGWELAGCIKEKISGFDCTSYKFINDSSEIEIKFESYSNGYKGRKKPGRGVKRIFKNSILIASYENDSVKPTKDYDWVKHQITLILEDIQ